MYNRRATLLSQKLRVKIKNKRFKHSYSSILSNKLAVSIDIRFVLNSVL